MPLPRGRIRANSEAILVASRVSAYGIWATVDGKRMRATRLPPAVRMVAEYQQFRRTRWKTADPKENPGTWPGVFESRYRFAQRPPKKRSITGPE
jgi:hypothetical protein